MFWERAKRFLQGAGDLDEAERQLKLQKAHLWPSENAAVVCEPLKEYRVWLAGGRLEEILALLPGAEDWARNAGYDRIVIHMEDSRPGWERVMKRRGFRKETVLAKEL